MTWAGFRESCKAPFVAAFSLEGRRAWAVMIMVGGGISMTVYAAFVLYIVKDRPQLAFYLGIGALMLIGIVITGFAGLIVKRDIDLNALGVKFRVSDQQVSDIANAVVAATPPPPPPAPPASVIVQTGSPPVAQ